VLRRFQGFAAVAAAACVLARAAVAGPPFVTDDPEPTDLGHWEIYNYAAGIEAAGTMTGSAGFDINYGGAPDLQLTSVIPVGFDSHGGLGIGDLQLAAKYRFVHQSDDPWLPDVAVFPRLFVPTGGRRFSTGRAQLFLPLWLQKDFGDWSVFGGGGYQINPGPGNRDFATYGLAVTRTISERWTVGLEVYHQTPDAQGARPFTGINLGSLLKLTDHWALLTAAGPGIQNAGSQGRYDFYVALDFTY
jgi:hypothetical protein